MEKLQNIITFIRDSSIAQELGIEEGDMLLSINGQAVKDIIDYKFLITDEYIEVLIKKKDGEEWLLEVEKDYDEDLGLDFENPIIDMAKSCSNKCIFCFIDQLPKGMRKTLYFKDDDSRLSFLQGNFITLTNLSDEDIERIIQYRISPLNISVHTTNPELRVKMLGNKWAGKIKEQLYRLTEHGIDINCQIVLVRGVNDGENLKNSIKELYGMYPKIKNVAIVPVGISKYRENLYPIVPFDKESSLEVLNLVKKMQDKIIKETGDVFVRCADEFYIMADIEIPGSEFYGEYEQLEDGIGMIANFNENINSLLTDINIKEMNKEISVVTGVSPYKYIKDAFAKIEDKVKGLKVNVHMIKNNFFGDKITVTGLLTGRDIIEQLKGKNLGEVLLLPSNLLKSGEPILLDDVTVSDIEKELNTRIKICSFDGSSLIGDISSTTS
ncbi:hypothetical protein OXPF_21830 [Oxobacter pfennigii]|uniref:Radical SAM superfamily protein n=1 Tax=Oxobacter pfennigii TaxID=36849 RepID=A0A0P8W7J0_9CLOT|nr:DUF512 domain-containing protein [Oxobacter pfennigii]KPU44017.1 hypothetical protein OXPF_21830 [Oxobacter pfennigii]